MWSFLTWDWLIMKRKWPQFFWGGVLSAHYFQSAVDFIFNEDYFWVVSELSQSLFDWSFKIRAIPLSIESGKIENLKVLIFIRDLLVLWRFWGLIRRNKGIIPWFLHHPNNISVIFFFSLLAAFQYYVIIT